MKKLSPRRPWLAATAVGALAVLAVLVVATVSAAARGTAPTSISKTAAHKCLVMTGLGRSRVRQELQSVHGDRPPERCHSCSGAFYEPLIITHGRRRRGRQYPWLASELEVVERQQDVTLNLAKGAKWSDGKSLTSADVVYSLTAGAQAKTMDISGTCRRARTSLRSVPGAIRGRDQAQDGRLAVHRGQPERAVRRPAAHLVEGREPATFTNPDPVGSGPFTTSGRFTTQDYIFTRTRTTGTPARRRSRASSTCRRRRTTQRCADPERPGRLDAQLRPERRAGVLGEGQGALPLVLCDDGVSDLAHARHDAVPVQHRCVPQGAEPRDQPQRRVEAR